MSAYDPRRIVTGADGTQAPVGADGLHVDVRSSGLPTGAATEATLASVLGQLDLTLSALRDALRDALAPVRVDPTGSTTQPVSDAGGSLSVDDGGGSLTVDGTVTATPSGTQDVDVVANSAGLASESTLATRAAEATLTKRHNDFASLIKLEAIVATQELRVKRIGVPVTELYHLRAPDGTSTAAAAWDAVRFDLTAAGDVDRVRYRTGLAYDTVEVAGNWS